LIYLTQEALSTFSPIHSNTLHPLRLKLSCFHNRNKQVLLIFVSSGAFSCCHIKTMRAKIKAREARCQLETAQVLQVAMLTSSTCPIALQDMHEINLLYWNSSKSMK
jgi:hypothetical protein